MSNTPLSDFVASPALGLLRNAGRGTQPSLRGDPCSAALALGRASFVCRA